jgi:hypothetical protein
MRTAPPTTATRASAIQARPRNMSCSHPRLRRHERTAARPARVIYELRSSSLPAAAVDEADSASGKRKSERRACCSTVPSVEVPPTSSGFKEMKRQAHSHSGSGPRTVPRTSYPTSACPASPERGIKYTVRPVPSGSVSRTHRTHVAGAGRRSRVRRRALKRAVRFSKRTPLTWGAALTVGLALVGWSGCETGVTRDPSVAVIVNDLHFPVRLRLCDSDDCRAGFHPPDETLAPDEDWQRNVSSVGVPNVDLVESEDEAHRYGCLPLVSPELRPAITVYVSEHVPCRDDLDEDAFWPTRWEQAGSGSSD